MHTKLLHNYVLANILKFNVQLKILKCDLLFEIGAPLSGHVSNKNIMPCIYF